MVSVMPDLRLPFQLWHHRPLAGTKLYCLVTESDLPRIAARKSDASPAPNHYVTEASLT